MIKKFFYYTIFIILLIIVGYSLFLIFLWFKDNKDNSKIKENINNSLKIVEKTNKNEEYIDLEALKKQNSDTIGFIKVDYTNINYPIVQTDNNEFYLNHTFDKTENNAGWIFLDYHNSKDFTDENTILYAHNRKDGSMFGTLINLLNNDNQIFIKIQLDNRIIEYQVFSVYTIPKEEYYLKILFTLEEKIEWLDVIKSRNVNKTVSVTNEDKVLTLSTCYGNDDFRLVVHAKRID